MGQSKSMANQPFFQHDFHSSILRAYDIRGIVGKTLFEIDAYAIGLGFAHIIRQEAKINKPRIAIGRDGRLTSPSLSQALCEGLIDGGAQVMNIGLGPTPMLYFADIHFDCDGAIQITGSHNPKDYNGFKMVQAHRSFYGEDIQQLGHSVSAGIATSEKGFAQETPLFDLYIEQLLDAVECDGFNLVWDTGNGAAGPAVEALTQRLAGKHSTLFTDVDGHFPNHHPDPVDPHTLGFLRDACETAMAHCGLGFDGDGDRLGVIDAKGRQVPGDLLTAYLATEFLNRHQGETILFDVKSSKVAMDIVRHAGGKPELWKTGHSHMKSRMREIGCQLAGEMSGHIFIKDHYHGFDDALYVALRVLQTMTKTKQSITDFMDALPASFASPECRVDCPDEIKFEVMDALQAQVKSRYDDASLTLIDGIRITQDDGWWLIRASNTEAALVVRAEGRDKATLNAKIDDMRTLLAGHNIRWDGPDTH